MNVEIKIKISWIPYDNNKQNIIDVCYMKNSYFSKHLYQSSTFLLT